MLPGGEDFDKPEPSPQPPQPVKMAHQEGSSIQSQTAMPRKGLLQLPRKRRSRRRKRLRPRHPLGRLPWRLYLMQAKQAKQAKHQALVEGASLNARPLSSGAMVCGILHGRLGQDLRTPEQKEADDWKTKGRRCAKPCLECLQAVHGRFQLCWYWRSGLHGLPRTVKQDRGALTKFAFPWMCGCDQRSSSDPAPAFSAKV